MSRRFEVRLTLGAERDFEALHAYLAEHRGADEAEALLEMMFGAIDSLEQFPERGAVPKELAVIGIADYRQLLVSPYRIVYRVIDNAVFVMLIADGRRDMQALLAQRLLGP